MGNSMPAVPEQLTAWSGSAAPRPVAQAPEALASRDRQKLRNAALEFEAILLSSWWDQMQKCSLAPDDTGREPGFDTLQSLGTRAVSLALAGRGGLGIANLMIRQLSPAIKANAPDTRGGEVRGR